MELTQPTLYSVVDCARAAMANIAPQLGFDPEHPMTPDHLWAIAQVNWLLGLREPKPMLTGRRRERKLDVVVYEHVNAAFNRLYPAVLLHPMVKIRLQQADVCRAT